MRITQKLLSLGKMARGIIGCEKVPQKFNHALQRIIIHWIGPYPGQVVSTPWNHWENGEDGKGVRASAHFILKDADVIQCVPLDEVAWHSGDDRNWDSIGIEVIPMNVEGQFSKLSEDTLRLLCQHIRKETGLDLPLKRHFDGTQGKPCPLFYTDSSTIISKDAGGHDMNGQDRWEALKLFINDFDRLNY